MAKVLSPGYTGVLIGFNFLSRDWSQEVERMVHIEQGLELSVCEMSNLIGQFKNTKFNRTVRRDSTCRVPLEGRDSLPLRACSSGHSY